jgi:hypothetical protein
MTNKIYDNVIINCGTGVSLPNNTVAEVYGNHLQQCTVGVQVRDQPLALQLGLLADTPEQLVAQLLASAKAPGVTPQIVEAEATKLGLAGWLGGAADVSTLAVTAVQLCSLPAAQALIQSILGS